MADGAPPRSALDPERLARLKEILLTARVIPEPERGPWIEQACGGDDVLRAEIESLQAFDAHPAGALRTGALAPALADAVAAPPVSSGRLLPSRIGPFRILGILGEGGMGIVYRAEQEHPVRREVALKVIRGALDSAAVVARFASERQALAMMDHPNVARLLDAGSTEDGGPYFVMELVRGVPITEYCRQARLDARARVELFLKVCRAVRHAHRRGVIHRDLKPSNLLVTRAGGEVAPKVIDFSVAKALTEPLLETEFRTRAGQVVGTLEYMAPEQALGWVDRIDTRSDVYALGVVLHELLTDRLPVAIEGVPLAEAIRRIATEPPPSLRRTTGSARLDLDLETILRKCLEKDPERRYSSAAELADDLERYLASRPILARPPSTVYQVRKLVGRHKVAFGFALTTVAFLIVLSATMAWQLGVQTLERRRAEVEARKAERISAFLQQMLQAASPEERGRNVTVRQVLDAAARRLPEELGELPEVDATIRETIGTTYRSLEAYPDAEKFLVEALRLREASLGSAHPATGKALRELAALHLLQDRYEDAEATARRALAIHEAASPRDGREVARDRFVLGSALTWRSRFEEAEPHLEEAAGAFRSAMGPGDADEIELATMEQRVAYLYYLQTRLAEAERVLRPVLARLESRLPADHPTVLTLRHWHAVFLAALERYDEAESIYRDVLARRRAVLGPDAATTARTMQMLAETLTNVGKHDEALALIREAVALRSRTLGPRAPLTADSIARLADMVRLTGRCDEGVALAREALNILREHFTPDHYKVANASHSLAWILVECGRWEEAEPYASAAVAANPNSWGYHLMAILHRRMGRAPQALAAVEEGLSRWSPEMPSGIRGSLLTLRAELGEAGGRWAAAEADYREAIRIVSQGPSLPRAQLPMLRQGLARCVRALGRSPEASRELAAPERAP